MRAENCSCVTEGTEGAETFTNGGTESTEDERRRVISSVRRTARALLEPASAWTTRWTATRLLVASRFRLVVHSTPASASARAAESRTTSVHSSPFVLRYLRFSVCELRFLRSLRCRTRTGARRTLLRPDARREADVGRASSSQRRSTRDSDSSRHPRLAGQRRAGSGCRVAGRGRVAHGQDQ